MIDQIIFLVRRGRFDYNGVMGMSTGRRLKILERVVEIVDKEAAAAKPPPRRR